MFKSELVQRWFSRTFVILTLALGVTANAHADCATPALPKTFAYGTIAVSNSLPVGAVIPGTVQSFTLVGQCSATLAGKAIVACPTTQYPVSGTTDVYSTGLAGVGMRMRNRDGTALIGSGQCSTSSSLGTVAADGSFNVSGTFELVKTGTIAAGTISPTASTATYNTGVLNTGVALNNNNGAMTIANGTAVRPVTCSVTSATANQTVALATVSSSALNGAGATAARTPFSIAISCDSGVKVAVTFSSASGSSEIPSVVASTGTATGVGIQLLDASWTPITLDTPRQLSSGTMGDTKFQFYAQYYRLGTAQVTPGSVNAAAIFTMSYQ